MRGVRREEADAVRRSRRVICGTGMKKDTGTDTVKGDAEDGTMLNKGRLVGGPIFNHLSHDSSK